MTRPIKRPTNMLLVDDDPSMVRLLTKVIEREFEGDIEVTSLVDPREARERIEQEVVEILVTDLEMPGLNGLELLRCAKRRNACTQVLFITGYSTLNALTDALELGATDYLLKPLDQNELTKLVGDAQERLLRWRAALADTLSSGRASQTAEAR